MRIAMDGRSLSGEVLRGWDRYAVGLARGLTRLGVELTFFHRRSQPIHRPHLDGIDCRVVGLRALSGLHYEQAVVPWAVGAGGFDLFHAPFEYGVPLACPRPVVLTIHSATVPSYLDLVARGLLPGQASDYVHFAGPSWRTALANAGVRRADHILTPSEFSREEIIRLLKVPAERVTTTPLGLAEPFLRPPGPPEARLATLRRLGVRPPFLLFVGGYEPHKNVEGLLRAFALVHQARPDLTLVLVGSRPHPDSLPAAAEALGLEVGRSVVFLAALGPELPDLYDASEMLVTLSWRETFCLPALEAMARGRPVVASAWGATPEVVGDAGRLVDPRDPAAARDAVLKLLDADRPTLEALARERAALFRWERTAEQTRQVYESLVRRRSRKSRNRPPGRTVASHPDPRPSEFEDLHADTKSS